MSLRGRQLFIGNIPFSVGWQDLKDLFRGAGVVQRANVIQGRDGRSKGHGIVLFATSTDADKAKEMFNGYEWLGRPLEVREDRSIQDFVPKKTMLALSSSQLSPQLESQSQTLHKLEEVDSLAHNLEKKLHVNTELNGTDSSTASSNEESISKDHKLSSDSGATDQSPSKSAQDRTVHVGNIPFRVRWQDLKDLFRKAGHVVRADVALGPDNRSRGFGTVIFSSEAEAKQAITMFDQYQWQDRVIHVQEDRSGMENSRHYDRGNNQGHGYSHGHNHQESQFRHQYSFNHNTGICRQVFVGNLPFQCQWQDLKDLFRKAGSIIRADVAHGYDGRSRGFGSVLFASPEEAKSAIEMFDNYEYNGRTLRVHYDRYSQIGHNPMLNGVGHMILPHMTHHPHLHPHQPHPHLHRMHPMHAHHSHGFHGNFHQPPLMPLGTHPMVHGGGHVPFSLGPPPLGSRDFSAQDAASSSIAHEFATSEGDTLPNVTSEVSNMSVASDRISTTTPFETDTNITTATIGATTSALPTSVTSNAHGVFTSTGILTHPEPDTSTQQFPFLTQLGPIGKPNNINSQPQPLHDLPNPGVPPGINSGVAPATAGVNVADDDNFGPRSIGIPYHFGNSIGDDDIAFTPRFYMYPGLYQSQPLSQQQQQQQQQQDQHEKDQPLAQQQQQQPLQSQQSALNGFIPPYQDLYSHEQLVHGRAGLVGGLGASALNHVYPTQPEWVAHPNTFMMGPPQHMYGVLPFGQYGHYRDMNNEIEDGEELLQQQNGY